MIEPELLKILACPACEQRPAVKLDEENSRLICTVCGRRYPIRNGIPVMLVEEAEQPQEAKHSRPLGQKKYGG